MLRKPHILSLFLNSFRKFIKHEHSCNILYLKKIKILEREITTLNIRNRYLIKFRLSIRIFLISETCFIVTIRTKGRDTITTSDNPLSRLGNVTELVLFLSDEPFLSVSQHQVSL